MSETIDYGNLMNDAMRGLIQKVLDGVAADGLPGEHHFFISFDTQHPDVKIASWLSDRYPEEMTIVVQNWFEGLDVTDIGFAITLNFGDNPEPLYVPYDALKTFVDPSVEFGLRFETQEPGEDDDDTLPSAIHEVVPKAELKAKEPEKPQEPDAKAEPEKQDADVVSLDSFRK